MVKRLAKYDEGVSAVIGVILMVAVTVILAAVIASFAFGSFGYTKTAYTVSATADRAMSSITVIYHGGPDNAKLDTNSAHSNYGILVNVFVWDNVAGDYPVSPTYTTHMTEVGSTFPITAPIGNGGQRAQVVVTATFIDGSQQV